MGTRMVTPNGGRSRRILCVERPQRPGFRRCLIWINECLPKVCLIRASALERAMPINRPHDVPLGMPSREALQLATDAIRHRYCCQRPCSIAASEIDVLSNDDRKWLK